MQNSLLTLAFLVISAILAAIVVPTFVDWTAHKRWIEAETERLSGMPVAIDGPISLSLLPHTRLVANTVTIGSSDSGARVGRLEAEVLLGPLLRGRLELASLSLSRAVVTVTPARGTPFHLMAVDDLSITDSSVSVIDPQAGRMLVAEGLRLHGSSQGEKGPLRLQGSGLVAGRDVPLQLALNVNETGALFVRLRSSDRAGGIGVEAEGIVAADDRPRFDGTVILTGGRADMPWRIAGRAQATRAALVFDRADLEMGLADKNVRGTGALRLDLGASPRFEAVVSARQVDLDRLAGVNGTPNQVLSALALKVPAATLPAFEGTVGFDVSGLVLGGQPLGDLTGDIVAGTQGWRAEQIVVKLPGESRLDAKGRFAFGGDPSFEGSVAINSLRPSALIAWLDGEASADLPADPITLSTELLWNSTRLRLDRLTTDSAAGRAQGRILVERPALGRHSASVDLTGDVIDLDRLRRLGSAFGARLDPATDSRVTLVAAQASLAGLPITGLDLDIATDGSRIAVSRARAADVAGVAFDLSGTIDGPGQGAISGEIRLTAPDRLAERLGRDPATAALGAALAKRAEALTGTAVTLSATTPTAETADLKIAGRLGALDLDVAARLNGSILQGFTSAQVSAVAEAREGADLVAVASGKPAALPTGVGGRLEATLNGSPAGAAIRARLALGEGHLDIDGQNIGARFEGAARLTTDDISALGPLFGLARGLSPQGSARGNARVSFDGETLGLADLMISSAGRTVRGTLAIGAASLNGSLQADRVDIEQVAVLVSGPAWLVEQVGDERPDLPLGRALIDGFSGELALAAGTVTVGPVAFNDVAAILTLTPNGAQFSKASGRAGEVAVTGSLALQRLFGTTRAQIEGAMTGVPSDLAMPGRAGRGQVQLAASAEGATPSALITSLAGDGRLTLPAGAVSGRDVSALARITREADRRTDLGRAFTEADLTTALDRELSRPQPWPPVEVPLILSGSSIRIAPVSQALSGGAAEWTVRLDLQAGSLAAETVLRADPGLDGEAPPRVVVHHEGPPSALTRRLDFDDLGGWLGLRMVERAGLALQMREVDRFERQRQRAFSRLPIAPPPEPVTVTPAI
ncbi:MAG: hypothetical protein WCH83_08085, partial [Alphaproteobacteria bacterium]